MVSGSAMSRLERPTEGDLRVTLGSIALLTVMIITGGGAIW
jgi:hypothetical protein